MKKYFFVILIFSACAFAAKDSSPSSIVRRGEAALRGRSTQVLMSMRIERPEFVRELRLRSWTLGNGKALVEILQPVKEEGICSLRVDNQMWNYLPKSDQVIRVPSSLMLQSWMGSDFTNDDLMKESSLVADYTHAIVRREKVGTDATVVIECAPKPGAPVVWGKILYWARVADDLPVKEEFYDEKGKLIRTMRLGKIKRMDDREIPTELSIEKAESPAERTTVVYEKALFDRNVPESLFNREQVRRASQLGRNLQAAWTLPALSDLN